MCFEGYIQISINIYKYHKSCHPSVTFARQKGLVVDLVSGKALNCDSRGCSEVKGADGNFNNNGQGQAEAM